MHNSKYWNRIRAVEAKSKKIEAGATTKINWWEAYLKRPAEHKYTKYRDYIKMIRDVMSRA